tara:strand:- start:3244 stop:3411 length:168 start_codon:yes stop_codon:yes gene_type:complete
MTCKEALAARWSVVGKKSNGYSEYATHLSFDEAQRFFNSLLKRGFKVQASPIEMG